ncbi:MAG: hypothetical protein H7Y27_00535 [Gemmatimonadaceae bacterium]|nr:hypothetical protein [Chitinophagaceae bacterium]
MNITRHNYETYFLLYTDNELSDNDRSAVDLFIEENPDLAGELAMLLDTKLDASESIPLAFKNSLLKAETEESPVNLENHESYFILYADNELSNKEKAMVEDFVYRNPAFQTSFETILSLKFEPQKDIVFPDKQSLYRKEKDDKVVPIWWKYAAAAIVLVVAGIFWLNNGTEKSPSLASGDSNPGKELVASNVKSDTNKPSVKDTVTPIEDDTQEEPVITEPIQQTAQKIAAVMKSEPVAVEQKIEGSNIIRKTLDERAIEVGPMATAAPQTIQVIDQPTNITIPADEKPVISYASMDNEDNIEVLNTTVNKKNSLRGFIRKASRFVSKRTGDDESRAGILIGGFEIAVK